MRNLVTNQGKKSDAGKSYVFYETLKTNLIQFPPKPLTRGLRARSQDAFTRKLMGQINELENHKKLSQEKLKLYERQIEDLIEQLGRMHSINKQFLHSKLTVNPAEVEFIVSELQNSELKGKLSQFVLENDRLRCDIDSLKFLIDKQSQEIKILEEKKPESVKKIEIPETFSVKSIEPRIQTPRVNPIRFPEKSRFGVKNLQVLHKAIADMSGASNFVSLISCLGIGVKRVLECEKVTVYLVSNFIQRLYLDSNDSSTPVQWSIATYP